MKSLVKAGLALMISALLAGSVLAQQVSVVRYVQVDAPAVNVRTQPNVNTGAVFARVRSGQLYPYLGESTFGNWYLIDLGNGSQGWVFSPLVEIVDYNVISGTVAGTNVVTPTNTLGQGGGVLPQQSFTPSTVVITPQQTTNPAALGQGGGVVPQATVQTSPFQSQFDYINSTVGVLGNLNIRNAPTTDARLLGRIPFDQRAVPLARNFFGTWILVNYNGVVGWVSAEFVAPPPSINIGLLPVQ